MIYTRVYSLCCKECISMFNVLSLPKKVYSFSINKRTYLLTYLLINHRRGRPEAVQGLELFPTEFWILNFYVFFLFVCCSCLAWHTFTTSTEASETTAFSPKWNTKQHSARIHFNSYDLRIKISANLGGDGPITCPQIMKCG